MRVVWLLVALWAIPTVHAELVIDDPTGDVRDSGLGAVEPPQSLGIDLVQATFTFIEEGVDVTMRVDDMESIDNGSPWIGGGAEYQARWDQEGFRDGSWMIRVFYSGSWSNMAEGPCLDGSDADGCAGGDRDIHDNIPMQVNEANGTVRMLLPADILPPSNVTWSQFRATTSAVQSAYPIFFRDEASDSTGFEVEWPIREERRPFEERDEPMNLADNRTATDNHEETEENEMVASGSNGTVPPATPREARSDPLTALVAILIVGLSMLRRRIL